MSYLLVILASCIAVELFMRLPVIAQAQRLFGTTRKAGHVIAAQTVSDHWKERVMLRYARELMMSSLLLILFIVGAVFVAVIPAFFAKAFVDPTLSIEHLFSSWMAIALSLLAATAYYVMRSRLVR